MQGYLFRYMFFWQNANVRSGFCSEGSIKAKMMGLCRNDLIPVDDNSSLAYYSAPKKQKEDFEGKFFEV